MRGPCCLCLLLISSIWVMSDAVGKVSENEESDANYNAEWLAFEKKFGKPGKLIRRSMIASTTEEPWTGRWLPERTTTKPSSTEAWTGHWLPEHTTQKLSAAHENSFSPNYVETDFSFLRSDSMGKPDAECDDGKTNITLDWDESPVNYTCYNPLHRYEPNFKYPAELEEEFIPPAYKAGHLCMDHPIDYEKNIPTFGNHRPLWPQYGEYKFLPRERWLHNLEHGAIVMLYHPCAHPVEVRRVRKIVTGCLWRHVISPSTLVEEDRPITLVAWGAKLSMSWANADMIRNFIRLYALRAPEGDNNRDGQYDHLLEVPSTVLPGSDSSDSQICPGQWA